MILKQKLISHEFSIIGLAYLNNDRLISASIDDTIKIWQRNKYEMFINKITIQEKKIGIEGLVNIDNETLITYSGNKSIQIWKTTNKQEIIKIKDKEKSENNSINVKKNVKIKRKETVDDMVKNSIKEMTEEKDNNEHKENKNEIIEINKNINENKI